MKASGKMTKSMAKVRKSDFLYDLFILTLYLDDSLGKWFENNGDKYEGQWKDDKKHGQGKKKGFALWFFDSNIVWWFKR